MIQKSIQAIMSAKIENTKIVNVTYKNTADIDHNVKNTPFFLVECEASYEKDSFVRTQVWLPAHWNGCFLGLGNGGMAGGIPQASMLEYVARDYAVALTDMGTSRGVVSGVNNPAVWRDFGWRATHEMTLLAKKLIKLHYGKEPEFSYFFGNSTGGQQALSLAQRFPLDYNGIIAGVHANNRVALHTYFLWSFVCAKRADKSNIFNSNDVENITKYAVEFFQQNNDGENGDNFVTYPWISDSTVADFLRFLQDKDLSDEKLSALEKIYNGPTKGINGKQIYCGMPIGSEKCDGLSWYLNDACHNYYPFQWVFGENFDPFEFDFEKDYEKLQDILSPELDANSADLSEFYKNGGKLIAYSGSSDPIVPFPDAVRYYKQVLKTMGGYEKVSEFYRYFIFPGKDHSICGDGSNKEWSDENDRLDIVEVIRKWYEKGLPPEYLCAARVENGKIVFTRKIYPYSSPQNAQKPIMKNCETV